MRMHVYESRRNNAARAVDHFSVIGRFDAAPDRLDRSAGHEQVAEFVEALRRIEQPAAG
jgi:hypothetical protein